MREIDGTKALIWTVCIGFVTLWIATFAYKVASHGPNIAYPADYVSFWIAGNLALEGDTASIYDLTAFAQHQWDAGFLANTGHKLAFFYPPVWLMFVTPLAILPYAVSLTVFVVIGICAGAYVLFLCYPAAITIAVFLASAATYLNVISGQNGLISLALFGAGCLLSLRKRDIASGILFGFLVYKPHLGILIPFALLAAGKWKTFFSALLTVVIVTVLTSAIFGISIWSEFLASNKFAVEWLEDGAIGFWRINSVFAATRVAGLPVGQAWLIQAVATLSTIVFIVYRFMRHRDEEMNFAILVAGAILAAPFSVDYDLAILSFPFALLVKRYARLRNVWVMVIFGSIFLMPIVIAVFAKLFGISLHPMLPLAMIALARYAPGTGDVSTGGCPSVYHPSSEPVGEVLKPKSLSEQQTLIQRPT